MQLYLRHHDQLCDGIAFFFTAKQLAEFIATTRSMWVGRTKGLILVEKQGKVQKNSKISFSVFAYAGYYILLVNSNLFYGIVFVGAIYYQLVIL